MSKLDDVLYSRGELKDRAVNGGLVYDLVLSNADMKVLRKKLKSLALQVIGEDEELEIHSGAGVKLQVDPITKTIRNKLRAELRQKVEAL